MKKWLSIAAVVILCLALVIGAACTCGGGEEGEGVDEEEEIPEIVFLDPEEYQPDRNDDAFHGLPSTDAREMWFFDAIFDNGYCMGIGFRMGVVLTETGATDPEYRSVAFGIFDPDGEKTETEVQFPVSEVSASTETCDVRMGDNYVHGEFPRYEIHFRSGDLGADLVFENLTQGYRNPPDGITALGEGWVVAQPRARVTGTLILDGEEMPVSGEGYHDHTWGVSTPGEGIGILASWNWGKLFLPNHTFVFNVIQLAEKFGGQSGGILMAFKGEELFQVLVSENIVVELSDFEVDELSGVEYSRKMVLKIDEPRIKGEVILRVRYLLEASSREGMEFFRALSDCDVKLDVDGEEVEGETQAIHEIGKPPQ
ncbi:MAG: hypothetical protein IMY83_03210 [Chloroflexi bacterium]|nr:hypothetical protein [Chloroflexota bacterium]